MSARKIGASLASLSEQQTRAARGAVKVALPARIESYDRATQRASISLGVRYCVTVRGQATARPFPVLVDVPVQWHGVTWDLATGDEGVALICDRSIAEWKQLGGASIAAADARRFDPSDAVFLPGVRSSATALGSGAYADGAVVLWDHGTGDVRLGSSAASDYVALSSLVDGELTTLETALIAAIDAGFAAVVLGDGGTAAFAAMRLSLATALAAWPGSVAAAKVKAE